MLKRISLSIYLLLLHAGAVSALFYFDLKYFLVSLLLWQLFGSIGIVVGYHRQLAHRTFESSPWILFWHLLCGALAGQAGPISWARVHRAHHRFADTENDPHSPTKGFWYGHFGWLLRLSSPKFNMADLESNPLIVFFEKAFFPLLILQLFLFWVIAGVPGLLWLGFFRIVLTLHSAWAINSLGHLFGYRNFETPDNSRNSFWLALFTAGEGYHNNHHQFPASAKTAHFSGEVDFAWGYIVVLEKLGLVKSIKLAKTEARETNFIYTT